MTAYVYPAVSHSRKHAPKGYAHYRQYRPWLRDEFAFRCVYCLTRERWGKGRYGFHVDHLIPQAKDPSRILDYDNLVYACATCNSIKRDKEAIPDPCQVAYGECLKVTDDGKIEALNGHGRILIERLSLDNEENTEYRKQMLEIIRWAESQNPHRYVQLMGFPDDLPDLDTYQPPDNSRLEGVEQSWFAKRKRGVLPETYQRRQ